MTYKLNPEIRKDLSPIVLIFSDGTKQRYPDGKAVVDTVFTSTRFLQYVL